MPLIQALLLVRPHLLVEPVHKMLPISVCDLLNSAMLCRPHPKLSSSSGGPCWSNLQVRKGTMYAKCKHSAARTYCMHTSPFTHMHTRAQTHKPVATSPQIIRHYTCMCHLHAHPYTCKHTCADTLAYMCIHARTHARAYTHTYVLTHTQACMHFDLTSSSLKTSCQHKHTHTHTHQEPNRPLRA